MQVINVLRLWARFASSSVPQTSKFDNAHPPGVFKITYQTVHSTR